MHCTQIYTIIQFHASFSPSSAQNPFSNWKRKFQFVFDNNAMPQNNLIKDLIKTQLLSNIINISAKWYVRDAIY